MTTTSCLAMLLAVGAAQTALAVERPPATSPLLGSWTVDLSRLPLPPAARPKRVTITFGDAGDGRWTTEVDIVDAAGTATHAVGTATLDGTPEAVEGSSEADIAALTQPTQDVLVMSLGKQGRPASTRVYAVARDGRTMVETAAYFGTDGRPIMRTTHFSRVR